ncbi:MAG: glycerol kinase GlpK [Pseudomonadota bacterium]
MTKYILALDQGTTSSRAMLFDRSAQIHGAAQQEFRQIFPQPGWVEHDAEEIWQSQLAVAQRVLKENRVSASDIAAMGMSNQRETTVIWDRKTGVAIGNAIVWQDRRTAGICDTLRDAGKAPIFQEKTGLVLDPYFSGTKVQWLLDHVAGAREKAERGELCFGTIDSWLIYKFSGAHITDTSNASRTLMFNIHTLKWDDELLEILNVPRSMMPRVVPGSGPAAHTKAPFFGEPICIAGIAGDQQAATFGQACLEPGMVKNTYGTGCFMLMNTGQRAVTSRNNMLTTIGWTLGDTLPGETNYMLEGSVFMAGAIVQWLRDGLGIIQSSSEIEPLAASVPDTGGVVFVPAFTGLGAPYWDAYARGLVVGMTRSTTKAHIARAALASIAYQTADVLLSMQKDTLTPLEALRVDGGASRNDLLMQFQADILGVPVERPRIVETTALGAAYLAGLGVGFWESQEEIGARWQMERRFVPDMGADERTERMGLWHRAIERAKGWDR